MCLSSLSLPLTLLFGYHKLAVVVSIQREEGKKLGDPAMMHVHSLDRGSPSVFCAQPLNL